MIFESRKINYCVSLILIFILSSCERWKLQSKSDRDDILFFAPYSHIIYEKDTSSNHMATLHLLFPTTKNIEMVLDCLPEVITPQHLLYGIHVPVKYNSSVGNLMLEKSILLDRRLLSSSYDWDLEVILHPDDKVKEIWNENKLIPPDTICLIPLPPPS